MNKIIITYHDYEKGEKISDYVLNVSKHDVVVESAKLTDDPFPYLIIKGEVKDYPAFLVSFRNDPLFYYCCVERELEDG